MADQVAVIRNGEVQQVGTPEDIYYMPSTVFVAGFVGHADFIPGVEPYDVGTVVELHETPRGVRMVLTFDAMHNDEWTRRATMGWESEIGKLGAVLEAEIARLPPGQRLVFTMRHHEGLKLSEIAKALNLAEGTVKRQLHAAVHRLRGALAGARVTAGEGA